MSFSPHLIQEFVERIKAVFFGRRLPWISDRLTVSVMYGDTNSTIAGAIAASKLHIPIAHVEAGLRSFNRRMPEEINRIVTDCLSNLLFCPTRSSADQLRSEGIRKGVHFVGDVMYDLFMRQMSRFTDLGKSQLRRYNVRPGEYAVMTLHRAENTDDLSRLRRIFRMLSLIPYPILFFVHPRTTHILQKNKIRIMEKNLHLQPPIGYAELMALGRQSSLILTDSGGLQKESYWLRVPCITLRDETEWIETVEAGVNFVVGDKRSRLEKALRKIKKGQLSFRAKPFGNGQASQKISEILFKQS